MKEERYFAIKFKYKSQVFLFVCKNKEFKIAVDLECVKTNSSFNIYGYCKKITYNKELMFLLHFNENCFIELVNFKKNINYVLYNSAFKLIDGDIISGSRIYPTIQYNYNET